jgi:hypothetical protein
LPNSVIFDLMCLHIKPKSKIQYKSIFQESLRCSPIKENQFSLNNYTEMYMAIVNFLNTIVIMYDCKYNQYLQRFHHLLLTRTHVPPQSSGYDKIFPTSINYDISN